MKKILFSFALITFFNISYCQVNANNSDNNQSEIKKSIAENEAKLSTDSSDQQAYYQIAMGYYKLQNFSTAIQYFSKLIVLNPQYPNALSNRGICELLLNQKDKAKEDFNLSIKYGQDPVAVNGKTLSKWLQDN